MKIGDIVLRKSRHLLRSRISGDLGGIIIDELEGEDGFFNYKVFFSDWCEWVGDLELEVIHESG